MKEKIKESLIGVLGTLGVLIYYLLGFAIWLISLMPMLFLDLNFWGYFILSIIILIPFIGGITQLILWCITIPTVIYEPFSALVCLYYIGLVIYVCAYAIPFIMSLIGVIVNFIANIFRR